MSPDILTILLLVFDLSCQCIWYKVPELHQGASDLLIFEETRFLKAQRKQFQELHETLQPLLSLLVSLCSVCIQGPFSDEEGLGIQPLGTGIVEEEE